MGCLALIVAIPLFVLVTPVVLPLALIREGRFTDNLDRYYGAIAGRLLKLAGVRE